MLRQRFRIVYNLGKVRVALNNCLMATAASVSYLNSVSSCVGTRYVDSVEYLTNYPTDYLTPVLTRAPQRWARCVSILACGHPRFPLTINISPGRLQRHVEIALSLQASRLEPYWRLDSHTASECRFGNYLTSNQGLLIASLCIRPSRYEMGAQSRNLNLAGSVAAGEVPGVCAWHCVAWLFRAEI